MSMRLRTTLDDIPFDAVHFDTLGLAQYNIGVNGCGTLLNHHNIESSMMTRRALNESNLFRRQYWKRYAEQLRNAEQAWCRRFDLNLLVSMEDQKELTEAIPEIKTMVVPNGTDTEYFKPRPDPGGSTLLFCGGLDWYPNADAMRMFFDQIWPRLIRELPKTDICIIGRNPPGWLRKMSEGDSRIRVTGFVQDPRPFFAKATAYVCPIVNGGGTRLKVLDALAMGVPLIGTSFACSGLALKSGEHVLLADTPESFVRQIQALFADAALRSKLSHGGRRVAETLYSWNVIGKKLIEAYEVAALCRGRQLIA
jgi:glycosyltransferase involved in cell wall biosynthesis